MPGPSLDFDWELDLFQALRGLWRALRPAPEAPWDPDAACLLEPMQGRLATFASVLAGRPVRVEATRGEGGIRGTTLLLPVVLHVAPDPELNASLYLLRTAIDATTIGRGFHAVGPEATVREARRSIDALVGDLPRFGDALAEARALLTHADAPEATLWGRLLEVALPDGAAPSGEAPPSHDASEEAALDVTDVHVLSLDEEQQFDAPIHSFEKVELLERFNGHLRQLDGDDDLQAHLDALEEVDLSALMRGGPQAHSMLRAEIGLDAHIPDAADIAPDEAAVYYPEWDRSRRAYRQDWCAVYPTPMPALPPLGHAAESLARQRRVLQDVRDQLLIERQRRRRRHRMPDGDGLDLDAVIAAEVERRAGLSPRNRVYTRSERRDREAATTLLVDVSLSADSWVANRRVWDVTRDALWVLGEAADEAGDDLQILAFSSHTRHRVRVYSVLDWHEPWSVGKHRLEHLQPQGYTRIGPALRHATAGLAARSARSRQLLLLSDCKPTDYDRYEGHHGTSDVHRALDEARAAGIRVHGLAVDDVARDRLPGMFGPGAWSLLRSPSDLARAVARIYGQRRL